jgi:hypothetical protein
MSTLSPSSPVTSPIWARFSEEIRSTVSNPFAKYSGKMDFIITVDDDLSQTIQTFYDNEVKPFADKQKVNVMSLIYAGKSILTSPEKTLKQLNIVPGSTIHTTFFPELSFSDAISYVSGLITPGIGPLKPVATPYSGSQPVIVMYYLDKFKSRKHEFLEGLFEQPLGVQVVKDSMVAPVIFYKPEHLLLFAEALGDLEIFHKKTPSEISKMILAKLTTVVEPDDEPYMSIVHVVFGDISGLGVATDDPINKEVETAYQHYVELALS